MIKCPLIHREVTQTHRKMTDQQLTTGCENSVTLETRAASPSPPPGPADTSTPDSPTSKSPSPDQARSSSGPCVDPATSRLPQQIPIDLIHIDDPNNGRLELDSQAVADLADRIQTQGLLHAITVRPRATGYELIAGRHRLAAVRRLRWRTIPAKVITADDLETATIRLAENTARTNLTPIEEAAQIRILVESHPEGADGAATLLNRSRDWIESRCELLDYPPDLQEHIHNKRISMAAARWLARIPNPETQRSYIRQAAQHGITATTAHQWYRDAINFDETQPNPPNFSRFNDENAPLTLTLIQCQLCQTRKDLHDTHPVRVCNDCLQTLARENPLPAPNDTPDTHEKPRTTIDTKCHQPAKQPSADDDSAAT